jgi:multidrug resistance protein, MATE family
LLLRHEWGKYWTQDPQVITIVSAVLPIGAFFQLSDALLAIAGGVLRGTGRQEIGGYLNLAGYYLFGLPFGVVGEFLLFFLVTHFTRTCFFDLNAMHVYYLYYLACFYFDWKLAGLWIGLISALWIITFIQFGVVYFTDWDAESEKASQRVGVHEFEAPLAGEHC